jgi:hypothetical protein
MFKTLGQRNKLTEIKALLNVAMPDDADENAIEDERLERMDNALIGAAMAGHVELAEELIYMGADIYCHDGAVLQAAGEMSALVYLLRHMF